MKKPDLILSGGACFFCPSCFLSLLFRFFLVCIMCYFKPLSILLERLHREQGPGLKQNDTSTSEDDAMEERGVTVCLKFWHAAFLVDTYVYLDTTIVSSTAYLFKPIVFLPCKQMWIFTAKCESKHYEKPFFFRCVDVGSSVQSCSTRTRLKLFCKEQCREAAIRRMYLHMTYLRGKQQSPRGIFVPVWQKNSK